MKQINSSGLRQPNPTPSPSSIQLVTVIPPPSKPQEPSTSPILSPSEIKHLKKSEEKLIEFMNTLGHLKCSELLPSIKQVIQDESVVQINSETVIQFCQTRVSKMIKNHRVKKNWGTQDINMLIWVLSKVMEFKGIQYWEGLQKQDWEEISSMIPGSNPDDCQFKWLNLNKNKLGDYSWTLEESTILSALVQQLGIDNWKTIAHRLYSSNHCKHKIFRTAKQCKQRWACYQNPLIKKGQWTSQEDLMLMKEVYKNKGMRKWSQISKVLNKRTENAIKNRYKLLLEKQSAHLPKQIRTDDLSVITHYLKRNNAQVNEYLQIIHEEESANFIKIQNIDNKSETSIKATNDMKPIFGKDSAFTQYQHKPESLNNEIKTQILLENSEISKTLQMSYIFLKYIRSQEKIQLNDSAIFSQLIQERDQKEGSKLQKTKRILKTRNREKIINRSQNIDKTRNIQNRPRRKRGL